MHSSNSFSKKFLNLISFQNWEPIHWTGVVVSALSRVLPHPPNFTPVGAMSLYAGARVQGWNSYLVPILSLFMSDFALSKIHGYDLFHDTLPIIYGSFLFNVFLGKKFLAESSSFLKTGILAAIASTQFYLVSNFGVWAISDMYPKSWEGLIACYIAALPFFQMTFLSDLIYSGILFGVLDGLEIRAGRSLSKPVSWAHN
ncbi:DUF6580 family putative transport protein [Leptospira sarikeiensis]|uniref:Uncharacterized protein n=1 Tax=Leptospira sarikeiensis TaxID=2484943 RepID=A0A4V6QM84_9LEPT|nr:DUF6580 family putative transport protein [Leptospira sarikeiensis]TGL62799.1 hypothetical protein EHQ64_07770 [Leptospira sarikeiensis]